MGDALHKTNGTSTKGVAMSLGTILLIAVAAGIAYIMYRVGRSSRESANAHPAAPGAVPFG